VSFILRPRQDGQNPMPLHENPTTISCLQRSQTSLTKPREATPQSMKRRNSCSTNAGSP
jgi:hypothetical protein